MPLPERIQEFLKIPADYIVEAVNTLIREINDRISSSYQSAAGADSQVQYNASGVLGGSSAFTFASNTLTVNGVNVGRGGSGVSSNSAVGYQSLNAAQTAAFASAFGYQALAASQSGDGNTAVGYQALRTTTTGYTNTAVGYRALYSSNGYANTAVGYGAMLFNTSGQQQTAVGYLALYKNTDGYQNQAFGNQALYENLTGINNTAVGLYALYSSVSGDYNVSMGFDSSKFNYTGSRNVVMGKGALENSMTGSENTAIGYHALHGYELKTLAVTGGSAVGTACTLTLAASAYVYEVGTTITISGVTPANYNGTFVVTASGTNSVSYTSSIAPGAYTSGGSVTNSTVYVVTDNTAIGGEAFQNFRSGQLNVVIGAHAAELTTTCDYMTAIGAYSLRNNLTGIRNTAFGYRAGFSNSTGDDNLFIGTYAGYSAVSNSNNVCLGYQSSYYRTSANNVAVGVNALLGAAGTSTGGNNVAVGHSAASGVTSGSGNIVIGYLSGTSITQGSNNIVIGPSSSTGITTGSGNVIIGGSIASLSTTLANNILLADGSGNQRVQIDGNGMAKVTGSLSLGAPVTKTADFTVAATENWLINNKAGSGCVVTLPAAATYPGRIINILNYQAQTVTSASGNVVPIGGGAAGTAIIAATAGKWVILVSDGTNWLIMQGN